MTPASINYKNIPVQPEILAGIVRLDVESRTGFRELDSFVSSDQGVAAMVLRAVNSPFYSRGRKVANIPHAISVLGFNVVRALAILAFSRSLFAQSRNPLFRTHIWHHSLLTAIAGQRICADLGHREEQDDAFVAGLMHDVGKVLLFAHNQPAYLEVVRRVLETGCSSLEAETQLLGIDHCQVGREAVVHWRLPERFWDYMAQDLSLPREAHATDPVCRSLALANRLIKGAGVGGREEANSDGRRAALAAFGVADAQCEAWLTPAFFDQLIGNEAYQLCAQL